MVTEMDQRPGMQWHYRIHWYVLRPLVRSYFRLTAQGLEHIPPTGPVLLAANHCSFLDPPLIALAIPRQITFLAKEELFSVPILSWWIRWMGTYPVSRGEGDLKAIRTVMRLMENHKALLIFPEGTRSLDGNLQPLENGLAWLALKTGAPVVPVYVEGTHQALSPQARFPRPCRVRMRVGPPLPPEPLGGRQATPAQVRALTGEIEKSLRALRAMMNHSAEGDNKLP